VDGWASAVLINNIIYLCGGLTGGAVTGRCGSYNPATNKWNSSLASLLVPVSSAGAGTDGKYMYVFGGRGSGTIATNGYNTVQRYDPQANVWISSDSSSSLAPLPVARGGMGSAVYVASSNEFYVIGGETDGSVTKHVLIYNVGINRWYRGPDSLTSRNGIYPIMYEGHVFVCLGSPHVTASASKLRGLNAIERLHLIGANYPTLAITTTESVSTSSATRVSMSTSSNIDHPIESTTTFLGEIT
jgi:hypothetical protein